MSEQQDTDLLPELGIRGKIMFWVSTLWLLNFGVIIHRLLQIKFEHEVIEVEYNLQMAVKERQLESQAMFWIYLILSGIVALEAIWRFFHRDPNRSKSKTLLQTIGVILVPGFRLALRDEKTHQYYWFPGLGWRVVDKELRKSLDRFFSIPMILIALSVLPVVGIEYYWVDTVKSSPSLRLFLAVGNAIIWFAFAFEFMVMLGVAQNVLRFVITQWINIAIILLPVLESLGEFLKYLRLARLSRLLRLGKLTRMGRIYRLRGLAMRAYRAFLVLEVLQRVFGGSMEKRLDNLISLRTAKEEELAELNKEILEMEERIAEQYANDPKGVAAWLVGGKTSVSSTTDARE